jgi:hypothetical protein
VISDVAPDFELLDAWALPVEGDREEFPRFLEAVAGLDPAAADDRLTRALFALRLRIGAILHWDDTTSRRTIPGCSETGLAQRLPEELRDSAANAHVTPAIAAAHGFRPLYLTDDEWAAEISNATVHGVLQLGWVRQPNGRYRAQLGIYVKTRGVLGRAYLKVIEPFRHLVVYPALTRQVGRAWEARTA